MLRSTRSNRLALVVMVLSLAGLGAWACSALVLKPLEGAFTIPIPTATPPLPPTPPGAPARLAGGFVPPNPAQGLRTDPAPAAASMPIPTPSAAERDWRPDRSQPAPTCELACQYAHNDALPGCGGYSAVLVPTSEAPTALRASCRRDLYRQLQTCMSDCGIEIPDPPKAPGAGRAR